MAVTSIYATEEPEAALAWVDSCAPEINIKYEVIPCTVSSVCLSFGLIYAFFGYRCFKMVMFFSGFMLGSAAVLLLYHKEPLLDDQLGSETKAGIGLGVGVLCGLMTMLVSMAGLLLSGLQLGSLLSLSVWVVVRQFYWLTPAWVPLSVVVTASIAVALFTLQWQKLFTIIYTSVFGATAVALCVDYLVGSFKLPDEVCTMFFHDPPSRFCWYNWAIAGILPVMSLIGVFVQWRFTGKGISHTADHKKDKKHVRNPKYRESRRSPHPHRRRRPPPLKRYAGDVLAPSYLQSIKEHQMGTGSSTSSVSTITRTLVDSDFETGSMVPLTAASPVYSV